MKPGPLGLIRLLTIVIALAGLLWAAFGLQRRMGSQNHPAAADRRTDPTPSEVAIQDGKTIDFSSGKPVVKNSPREKAIIDAAVKEMDAAAKDVTFAPTAPAAEEKKKAESAGIPPKP